jgi:hypothetical protein
MSLWALLPLLWWRWCRLAFACVAGQVRNLLLRAIEFDDSFDATRVDLYVSFRRPTNSCKRAERKLCRVCVLLVVVVAGGGGGGGGGVAVVVAVVVVLLLLLLLLRLLLVVVVVVVVVVAVVFISIIFIFIFIFIFVMTLLF